MSKKSALMADSPADYERLTSLRVILPSPGSRLVDVLDCWPALPDSALQFSQDSRTHW
jgi:hypothetical protein